MNNLFTVCTQLVSHMFAPHVYRMEKGGKKLVTLITLRHVAQNGVCKYNPRIIGGPWLAEL